MSFIKGNNTKKEKQEGKFFTIPMIIAISIMALLVFVIIFGDFIMPYDPDEPDVLYANQMCSPAHLFGTDGMGRDIFSRMIIGSRTTLYNAVLVVLISVVVGIPIGLICGYYRGIVDMLWMRTCDVILSFPTLILGFVLVATFGKGEYNAVLATGIVYIPMISKLARSLMITEKNKVYVEAAKTLGYSDSRIIFRHILPNCVSTLMAELTLDIGYAIGALASLSFIGMGVQPPTADWGNMLQENQTIIYSNTLPALIPGIAIVVVITAFNVLSDGIQMYIDPTQRNLPTIQRYKKRMEKKKKLLGKAV